MNTPLSIFKNQIIIFFKIINEISNYDKYFFNTFSSNWEFFLKTDFKN